MSSTATYYQTNLETDIIYLKGVGPQRGNALKKYGIAKNTGIKTNPRITMII